MGRAIVRDPQVFLFDEPLSNLDAKLRVQMRTEIKELHQRLKTTSIYVTHDQIEAMTMADKIVVMRDGRIEQTGSPLELYDRPANQFVAGFIGSPAMNFLPGLRRSGGARASSSATACRCCRAAAGRRPGRPAGRLRHRPEHMLAVGDEGVPTQVVVVEPTGGHPGPAATRAWTSPRCSASATTSRPAKIIRLRPTRQRAHLVRRRHRRTAGGHWFVVRPLSTTQRRQP
jgi:multiple sugar transport system ATP-binding protein